MPVTIVGYTPNTLTEAAITEKIAKMTTIYQDLKQKASPESQAEALQNFQNKIDREKLKSNPRADMIKLWQQDIKELNKARADYAAKVSIAERNVTRFKQISALKPEEKIILKIEPTSDKKADSAFFENILTQIEARKKSPNLSGEEMGFLDAMEEKISTAKDRLFTYERSETTEFILSGNEIGYLQRLNIPEVNNDERVKAYSEMTQTQTQLEKEKNKYVKSKKMDLASEYNHPLNRIAKMKADIFAAPDKFGLKITDPAKMQEEVTKLLTILKANIQGKKEEKSLFSVLSPISSFTPFKSLKTSRGSAPETPSSSALVRSASAPPSTEPGAKSEVRAPQSASAAPSPGVSPLSSAASSAASSPATSPQGSPTASPRGDSPSATQWKKGAITTFSRSASTPDSFSPTGVSASDTKASVAPIPTSASSSPESSPPSSPKWKRAEPSAPPEEEGEKRGPRRR